MLARLEWSLQARLEHVSEVNLSQPNYLEYIFRILDALAGEREEDAMKRALPWCSSPVEKRKSRVTHPVRAEERAAVSSSK